MKYRRTETFAKQYRRLPKKLQDQFDERLRLFAIDATNPILRVHPLIGNYRGYWSMNVSGELRALYYYEGEIIVVFAFIGSHSQLYK